MTYLEYQKTVFNWLMKQHTNNNAFRFNVLIQPSQEEYESYYFSVVTNNESFKTSFWNIPVTTGRGGGYLIEVRFLMKKDKFKYYIHLCGSRETDAQNLAALKLIEILKESINTKFELLRDSPNIADPYYDAKPRQESYNKVDLLLNDLYNDLNALFPLVSTAIENVRAEHPLFQAGPIQELDFLRNIVTLTQRIKSDYANLLLENNGLLRNNPIVAYDYEIERIAEIENTVVDNEIPIDRRCPEQIISTLIIYSRKKANNKIALTNSEFRCELEDQVNAHTTFTSRNTGQNFVEAHHLVPMKAQHKYAPASISLDVPENIVALCPNCHKMIHLAENGVKTEKVTILYERRQPGLNSSGIDITLNELLNLYFEDDDTPVPA